MSERPTSGFVNAHTHLYSGLVPLGMPAPDAPPGRFVEILERVWWRLDRALDAASLRAAARFYVADAIASGTGVLIDHHESPRFIARSLDVVADACQEFGMRALVCYGATERNKGRREARCGLRECRRFILANRRPLVAGLVGLHASFTVSDETIREAGALCRDLGTVLHLHVAEDRADVEDAKRRGYAGPIERLRALDALVPGSILAHGVWLTRDQVRMAGDAGCWLVHNPRSNRNNGVGYAGALGASTRVALGTDGFSSNMRDELDALLEEGAAGGESAAALTARLDAGWDLVAERFGIPLDDIRGPRAAPAGPAGSGNETARPLDLESIRAEAQVEADRLWARMRTL